MAYISFVPLFIILPGHYHDGMTQFGNIQKLQPDNKINAGRDKHGQNGINTYIIVIGLYDFVNRLEDRVHFESLRLAKIKIPTN
jgi:hypothetical protein